MSSPFKYYEYLINVEVNEVTCRIKVELSILRNGLLWNVKKTTIYQTLFRIILSLNWSMNQYSAKLDPRNGTFKIMSLIHFKLSTFSELLRLPFDLCALVINDAQEMIKTL